MDGTIYHLLNDPKNYSTKVRAHREPSNEASKIMAGSVIVCFLGYSDDKKPKLIADRLQR